MDTVDTVWFVAFVTLTIAINLVLTYLIKYINSKSPGN
jgi:hypothetical protein